MALDIKYIKKVLTDLTCVIHKPKWVGQSWVRISSTRYELQNKSECTRCGKEIFKPIGE